MTPHNQSQTDALQAATLAQLLTSIPEPPTTDLSEPGLIFLDWLLHLDAPHAPLAAIVTAFSQTRDQGLNASLTITQDPSLRAELTIPF